MSIRLNWFWLPWQRNEKGPKSECVFLQLVSFLDTSYYFLLFYINKLEINTNNLRYKCKILPEDQNNTLYSISMTTKFHSRDKQHPILSWIIQQSPCVQYNVSYRYYSDIMSVHLTKILCFITAGIEISNSGSHSLLPWQPYACTHLNTKIIIYVNRDCNLSNGIWFVLFYRR
jgi:hypothetical protein